MNYRINNTFEDLKESIIQAKVFYWYERRNTKGETKRIIEKIYNILRTTTNWIYEVKTDEDKIKRINKIMKAYKKIEKYEALLTY